MNKIVAFILMSFMAMSAQASIVAIIDSGTDMLHKDIEPQAWINQAEIPRNDRDEDHNGYQDDVHGWNFAENNNQVIDYSYLGTLTFDIRKFFGIQTKFFHGTATEEEINWMREQVKDQDFIKQISIYGNFMHGTHVAGIASKNNQSQVLAVKLIPTEVKLPGQEKEKGLGMFLLKKALDGLAKAQMNTMEEIGAYVAGHKADVANGSFGTGYPQARTIVETIIKTFVKNPKEDNIVEGTKYFLNAMIREGARMVNVAPKTLFVFAAGNDGLNNDEFPTSPTNIKADNVISVAATMGRSVLATFSNYGKDMVDVAAPGVAIESTVPGNQYLEVSGTSQAAPYVANIAAMVKDSNPDLTPGDIKKIILGTVDKKDFLKGKVLTDGLVNKGRAVKAAELSLKMNVKNAIAQALVAVDDVNEKSINFRPNSQFSGFVLPLPSNFVIRK